jgi:peptidyl-tRNA hydrolase, PTH2 family
MYLFLNRSLGMSTGKAAAQVAHAAVEAYLISNPKVVEQWRVGLHYCKLVMLAEDDVHLLTIQKYIEERGFKTKIIIDEGRTEIRPLSTTALGVEVVDRDEPHTQATFETFKLYREAVSSTPYTVVPPPPEGMGVEGDCGLWWPEKWRRKK